VADEGAVDALIQRAVSEFGRLDIVVNNAGAARGDDRTAVTNLDYGLWKKVLVTNLDGTFLMSRAAARQLIAQGDGGSIVNVSSIASVTANADQAAYAASKAGINALSHSLAMELAKHKIRVNALLPGIIDTFRMDDLGRGELWQKTINARIPLGYPGDGSECAEMVLFLVSDRGKWITGKDVIVDGGTVWK
jgi:3-oxoacyl-[acyl-carrier protein] reductase/meso-butanediol dehydrogenase/(S,S)-butanediol dehydrogenase/diacetyl reductase